jgi:DNA polymerase-1
MIQMMPTLRAQGLRAKMLLQVHDELIFEVPVEEVERTAPLVKQVMEQATSSLPAPLAVPLVVDVGTGESWGTIR